MCYYHADRPSTITEVSQERARELQMSGEFVTTSYANAVFYLLG